MNIVIILDRKISKECLFLDLWFFIGFLFFTLLLTYWGIESLLKSGYINLIFLSSLFFIFLSVFFVKRSNRFNFICVKIWLLIFVLSFFASYFNYILRCQEKGYVNTITKLDKIFSLQGKIEIINPKNLGKKKDLYSITLNNVTIKSLKNICNVKKKKFNLRGKAEVQLSYDYLRQLNISDTIDILVMQKPQKQKILPNGYDFSLSNRLNNIVISCYALTYPKLLKTCKKRGFFEIMSLFRYKLYKCIKLNLGGVHANFTAALLVGQSKGIDSFVMQNMRNSGLSHILCVSGLHVSLVVLFFYQFFSFILNLFSFFALRFDVNIVSCILSLFFSYVYWIISGMNVATTRALILILFTVFAKVLNRNSHSIRVLGIAMVVTLFLNPDEVLSVSFQLSFLATFALMTSNILWSRVLCLFEKRSLLRNLINSFLSSITITIFTMPVVIYHFYVISTYQIFANLLAIPIVTFFLVPCAAIMMLFLPFNFEYYPLYIMSIGIDSIIKIASYFANASNSLIFFGNISPCVVILFLLAIFFFVLFKQKFFKIFSLFLMSLSILLFSFTPKPDLIISEKRDIIGCRGDKKLVIYSNKASSFIKRYWSSWYGQKYPISIKVDVRKKVLSLISRKKNKILVVDNEVLCKDNYHDLNLVINLYNDDKCFNSKFVFTKSELSRYKSFVVFISDKKCVICGLNQQNKEESYVKKLN